MLKQPSQSIKYPPTHLFPVNTTPATLLIHSPLSLSFPGNPFSLPDSFNSNPFLAGPSGTQKQVFVPCGPPSAQRASGALPPGAALFAAEGQENLAPSDRVKQI